MIWSDFRNFIGADDYHPVIEFEHLLDLPELVFDALQYRDEVQRAATTLRPR